MMETRTRVAALGERAGKLRLSVSSNMGLDTMNRLTDDYPVATHAIPCYRTSPKAPTRRLKTVLC